MVVIKLVTGLPGSGKTHYLVSEGLRALRRGRPVFADFRFEAAGLMKLRMEDFADGWFPPGSLLLVDEGGCQFNSRDWESTPREVLRLFMTHRHFGLDLLVSSQSPGRVDKVMREVAQAILWAEAWPFVFIYRHFSYDIQGRLRECRRPMLRFRRRLPFDSQYLGMGVPEKTFETWEGVLVGSSKFNSRKGVTQNGPKGIRQGAKRAHAKERVVSLGRVFAKWRARRRAEQGAGQGGNQRQS